MIKIRKKDLKKIIREAFIGQVNKPPVHTQTYTKNIPLPDEYESMRPLINKQLQSGDLETKRSALNMVGSISNDDMAYTISDASLEDESFIKDEKPLDKDKSRIQTILNKVESEVQTIDSINSYLEIDYAGDLEDYEVVLKRETINKIYGLIALGKDADAKKVAMNYLDTTFISDNKHIANNLNQMVADWGALSFSDLFMNQQLYSRSVSGDLEISIYGILDSDFKTSNYKHISIYVSFNGKTLIEGFEREFESQAEAKKFAFAVARMTGALSMPSGTHMAAYHFKLMGFDTGFACEIICS